MIAQFNGKYLKDYATQYASLVSNRFFSERQFITGQEIIQLTSCTQVNFFIIKRLFELWQEELSKLKSSPYFDYRDIAVHEALTQFMNVLSRRIKIERSHFEPMLQTAVEQAVILATDPVVFYQNEIKKAPSGKINEFLRENKKYYKWHDRLITLLIDKAGFGNETEVYHRAISANYQAIRESLEPTDLLLATLGDIKAFNIDLYQLESLNPVPGNTENTEKENTNATTFVDNNNHSNVEKKESVAVPVQSSLFSPTDFSNSENSSKRVSSNMASMLNPFKLRAQFASETYRGMKGVVGELSENLALNQRFMFTKELFDGNSDLLLHALKSIEEAGSFDAAVELINARYLKEMGWEIDSEPVNEFMLLIYRKFAV